MTTPEIRAEELGRASKRAAILSALGALIVIASLVFSWYQLHSLDREIAQKKQMLSTLTDNIEKLTYAQVGPQNAVFQLRASAKSLHETNSAGDPLYTFSLYVQGAQGVLNQIQKVGYDRNHPTFPTPYIESDDSQHKFLASWQGWGCLSEMYVTVFWKDGTSKKVPFDMCKALGLEWEQ